MKCCLAISICLSLLMPLSVAADTLTIAADPWCPYNCEPNSDKPGYTIDILKTVFAGRYDVNYISVPWNRALLNARNGEFSGVVGAGVEHANENDLLIGKEPIGISNDCLFVSATKPLKFSVANDLNGLRRVGIVDGYTYEHELGTWLNRPENKSKIDVISGENVALRSAQRLLLGRVDAIIENGNVMNQALLKNQLTDKIISAGCQQEVPVYAAFSKKLKNVNDVVNALDAGIIEMRKNGQLQAILTQYGLTDWKQ